MEVKFFLYLQITSEIDASGTFWEHDTPEEAMQDVLDAIEEWGASRVSWKIVEGTLLDEG